MPKPTPLTIRVVTVCFSPSEHADWFAASEKVHDLLHANGTPAHRYHVRHRTLIGWVTRFLDYHLLDPARRFGAITTAAGGRKGRLDLTGTAATAARQAAQRWRAWNAHVAVTTRPARTWEDYLAQHHADPAKVTLNGARRRFEQQPRVLAMLAQDRLQPRCHRSSACPHPDVRTGDAGVPDRSRAAAHRRRHQRRPARAPVAPRHGRRRRPRRSPASCTRPPTSSTTPPPHSTNPSPGLLRLPTQPTGSWQPAPTCTSPATTRPSPTRSPHTSGTPSSAPPLSAPTAAGATTAPWAMATSATGARGLMNCSSAKPISSSGSRQTIQPPRTGTRWSTSPPGSVRHVVGHVAGVRSRKLRNIPASAGVILLGTLYRAEGQAVMVSRRQVLRLALVPASAGGGVILSGCAMYTPSREPAPPASLGPEEAPQWSPGQAAGLFRTGSRHLLDSGEWATATTLSAGVLHLPTGRLVAADPSWLMSWERLGIAPFTAAVPPGSYPLTLAVVERREDRRVAAAKLAIRDDPVAAWEMALRPDQDPGTLREGEAFVVGVDVATIALFDAVALDAMARRTQEDPDSYYVDKADRPVELRDRASGTNLIAFNTGWGDGGYPVWIGRTTTGAVACFIVDMAMLAPPASTSNSPS